MLIIKLGGTSQCKIAYDNLIKEINNENEYFIILSAPSNYTNWLINLIDDIDTLGLIHKSNKELLGKLDLELNLLDELEEELKQYLKEKDRNKLKIIGFGERFSTRLLSYYLINNNINCINLVSTKLITSDDDIDYNYQTTPKLKINDEYYKKINERVIITEGFSGLNTKNEYFLIGRGGSDTTGSIIADYFNAKEYQIWTDVDGIYPMDPRYYPCNRINKINYQMSQELAASGAKVLHPYCILPCAKKNIPIIIVESKNYVKGTIIHNQNDFNDISLTNKDNIIYFEIKSLDMWNNYGFVNDIFDVFKQNKINVDIITTSQFSILTTTEEKDLKKILQTYQILTKNYQVNYYDNNTIINLTCENILLNEKINKIITMIKKDIKLIHYSSNNLTVSLLIDTNNKNKIMNDIYQKINLNINLSKMNQWINHYPQLDIKEPTYVYHLDTISYQVFELLRLDATIFYSVKANNNKEIISFLNNMNINFECVSIDEVEYILQFTTNNKITFTPNFNNIKDIIKAFELDVNIIIDNLNLIKDYPDVFKNKKFGLRIDLNNGSGHHSKVITQGKESKFGITNIELLENLDMIYRYNISGLHTHSGSYIKDINIYLDNLNNLTNLANKIPSIEWLNIGGGLAINIDFDFDILRKQIRQSKYQIHLESGRFIVANSGVLISPINQIKIKEDINYLGIESGMNHLIRTALYDARHPILNLSKLNQSSNTKYRIVGTICESGDVFGDYYLPKSDIDDLIIIFETGAYGQTMNLTYNMKKLPNEIYL